MLQTGYDDICESINLSVYCKTLNIFCFAEPRFVKCQKTLRTVNGWNTFWDLVMLTVFIVVPESQKKQVLKCLFVILIMCYIFLTNSNFCHISFLLLFNTQNVLKVLTFYHKSKLML